LGKKFAIKAKKDEKTEKSSNFATLLGASLEIIIRIIIKIMGKERILQ
jgi:hypothetical protein